MNILKKTLGVCLIGLGVGMLLVLLLPTTGWLFGIGIILLLLGIFWLCKWKEIEKRMKSRLGSRKEYRLRKDESMRIVVYKPGKFMRKFFGFLFGIKKHENWYIMLGIKASKNW